MPDDGHCVVLSIPYDEGWQVQVDGKKAEIKKAVGMLLSFESPTESGASGEVVEHKVELKYIPMGFWMGLFVSFVGFLAFFAIVFCKKFRVDRVHPE